MAVGLTQEFIPRNRAVMDSQRASYLGKLSAEAKRKRALEHKIERNEHQRLRPTQSYVDTIRRNIRRLSAQIQASNDAKAVQGFTDSLRKLVDVESILIGRVVQTGKVRSTNPLPKLSDLDPITPKLSSTAPQPCQPPLTPVEPSKPLTQVSPTVVAKTSLPSPDDEDVPF